MSEKKTCFVVTPIGDESTTLRRHIDGIIDQSIIPAIGENFNVSVAHREYEIGSINDRIIQSVYNSDLVIANLTGLNPNVMFELAVRYSFGKPAIVIAQVGTKLPFDIVDENTIFYVNDPAGAAELKEKIKGFADKIDWSSHDYGPIVSAINRAAVVNSIEVALPGEENKNAFSFLVEKITDLESEIKGIRHYQNSYVIDEGDLSIKNIIETIKSQGEHMTPVGLENYLDKAVKYFVGINDPRSVVLLKDRIREEVLNDSSLSKFTKTKILNALTGLEA